MLKIDRKEQPQQFLELIEHPKEALFEWARMPLSYRQQRRAPLESDMFHQRELRLLIATEFDHKCAYCERHLGEDGDVDHFRPKSLYPWLAFEWVNLFYVCSQCNRSKSNNFPVSGRHAPFLATVDEIQLVESSLLVDPSLEHPGRFLLFLSSGHVTSRNNSKKGSVTIDTFQLNEQDLVYEREKACEKFLSVWKSSLASNIELPEGFLSQGNFLACQQWTTARSIAGYKKLSPPKVTGQNLEKELKQLHLSSSESLRTRLLDAIEELVEDDKTKSIEFRSAPDNGLVRSRDRYFESTSAVPHGYGDAEIEPIARSSISSISISNFKAIEKLSLDMPSKRNEKAGAPCLLILGENAVGKSSLLLGIGLALLGSQEVARLRLPYSGLARSVGRNTWDQWGKEAIDVTVEFHEKKQPTVFSFDPLSGKLSGTQQQSTIVLGYGPHRYFSPTKGWRSKKPSDRLRSLFDPTKPLPDPTDWLNKLDESKFNAVARTIRTILPIGYDDDLINDPQFGICVRADGQITPVSKLSEGYRSVFAMVADMCRTLLDHWSQLEDARAVVLIDEIDAHLHPRWKMQVMSSLRRALPKVQFIVTSHDPLCVRGMDDGEVTVLYRDETGRVSQMEDLPNVSGMQAEQLLTSEYFGLASTLDADLHLNIARISSVEKSGSVSSLGEETDNLISRLTVGDSATAQIIQEALYKYLLDREKPIGGLSQSARSEAVLAVAQALRAARGES